MRYFILVFMIFLLLTGCAATDTPTEAPTAVVPVTEAPAPEPTETQPPETEPLDPLEETVKAMSLEELAGQLLLARCPEEDPAADLANYHLGGYILFGRDFEDSTPVHTVKTLAQYQASAKIPLLIAVDEEGGTVCRVSNHYAFRNQKFPSPQSLFNTKGMEKALEVEGEKANFLRKLGINVNMAPVCDVTTQPGAFMYARSLGQKADITAEFVAGAVEQYRQAGVGCVLKHFPGYGNTADTHTASAVDSRPLETLEASDLLPFAAGIEAGAGAVLVSHALVEAFDPELPASLSPGVHDYLRQNMGFDGVIVTDDLAMGAVAEQFEAGEAAVLAVLAGNDLLCSSEYRIQHAALVEAAQAGRISRDRLEASALRILRWKQDLGLIPVG